jgi:putative ABC transport system permease protein
MNLAFKDIRHNVGRFVLTTTGIGLLLMIVMGMVGIYRGLVQDATLLVDQIGADLWIVQKNTRGPFAEVSRLPESFEDRARVVLGVASARAFVSHTIQREYGGRPLRLMIQGLAWPQDNGQWLPIVAGRSLRQNHYEMIADRSLGIPLGETLYFGKEAYAVVGLTEGMVSSAGDGMAFFTLRDVLAIQFDVSGEAIRAERAARRGRLEDIELGHIQPQFSERALGPASEIPALGTSLVSGVLVDVAPGYKTQGVASQIASWPDVTVYTHEDQRGLLLRGNVDRARRQLGLFMVLLVVVSGIIMALILYTLTLDKIHDIALLKLIGARNTLILGLILQQSLLFGGLGYCIAYVLGQWIFPLFPRRVVVLKEDLYSLGVIVLVISVAASILGIWKALRIEPNEVLA